MKLRSMLILMLAVLCLGGCATQTTPSASPTAIITVTATVAPTPSSTPIPTSQPAVIPLPSPSLTPTPDVWSPSIASRAKHLGSIGLATPTDAAWSPDGEIIAVSSLASIMLYEAESFQYLQTVGTGGAHFVTFSPDGTLLAALGTNELVLFDLATGQIAVSMHTTGYPSGLAFSPDGKSVFTSDWGDNGIHVWDTSSGSLQHTLDIEDAATSLASNPDGTRFAVGNRLGTVMSWDIENAFASQIVQRGDESILSWVNSMAYSPNGDQLAVTHANQVHLYDSHTGSLIRSLSGNDLVSAVAFSPHDQLLAYGGDSGNEASLIYVADLDTGEMLRTLQNPSGAIQTLRFNPDGSILISLSRDRAVRLWDVASGNMLGVLGLDSYTESMFSIAFTLDGRYLFSGERLGALRMWDVGTQQLVATLVENSGGKIGDPVYELAVSPDGNLLASANTNSITLWSLPAREQDWTINAHGGLIKGLVFTPDSKTLISAGWDGAIRLWDASTGTERADLPGYAEVFGVALTEGEEFLSVGGQTVRIWSWRTGHALGVLRRDDIHPPHESLTDVAFCHQTKRVAIMDSRLVVQIWDAADDQWYKLHEFATNFGLDGIDCDPSGRLVAFGSDAGLVRVMDTESGEVLTALDVGSEVNIHQVLFSPDGRLLTVACTNGEVQMWGIN